MRPSGRGMIAASAGRSTSSSVPRVSLAIVQQAAVLPAGEERVRGPVAHELQRHLDRGALLERGPRHRLGHADLFRRVHHFDGEAGPSRAPELLGHDRLRADQQHAHAQLTAGRHGALGHHPRSVVAAQGVHGHARRAGGSAQTSSTAITALPL